ncbi:MAG: SDR family NAD(P)-dependent oxidoreductase [Geminicoccaceae bacterium]
MTVPGLKGQTAIITGAARGIGLGIAERFAELGADVIGWDVATGNAPHFNAFFECDVTDEASVAEAEKVSLAKAGHVDILVNNAGINGPTKPTWAYTLAEWQKVLAVDLTGVFLCSRALVGPMRERGYGRIVNIASIAGKEGGPNACAYAAAKSGVIGFTKGLAQELAGSGVLVNAIAPAITETDLFAEMDEAYIADRKRRIPMGRFCTIREIADMAAFAASRECSFTTGFTFDVTGGRATY